MRREGNLTDISDEYKALFGILNVKMNDKLLKDEILRQIEEELGRPENEINSRFIEVGIDYLCKTEGVTTPVFKKAGIRRQTRKIKSAAGSDAEVPGKKILHRMGKMMLAACMALVILFLTNYVYIGETGRCMFNGMFNNVICYAIGYKTPGDLGMAAPVDRVMTDMASKADMPMENQHAPS